AGVGGRRADSCVCRGAEQGGQDRTGRRDSQAGRLGAALAKAVAARRHFPPQQSRRGIDHGPEGPVAPGRGDPANGRARSEARRGAMWAGLEEDELIPVFAAARNEWVKIVLDVAIAKPGDYVARLRKLLPDVDIFPPNNPEGKLITGQKDPLRQADAFRQMGA